MKKSIAMAAALIVLAVLPACRVSSGGYYAGSGIYHDDNYYNDWSRDHRNRGGWGHREDRWDRNRHGRIERERDAYRNQIPNRGRGGLTPPDRKIRGMFSLQKSDFQSTDSRVILVASKYGISDYAATYIVRAVELAKADDDSGIRDLGLDKQDFEGMLKGKLAEEKIETVGAKLLMSSEDVEQMLFDIKNDIQYAHSKN